MLTVEARLRAALGVETARAAVSFVGVEEIEVLRHGPDEDGLTWYATLGMSRRPMTDPTAVVVDASGPRAELLLALREPRDSVLRSLAVLAAMPSVEGVVVRPGATFDLGVPLWEGGRFSAVLVGEPALGAADDAVELLPLDPITADEQAYKRVHGPAALRELWRAQEVDLRDPQRPAARLG